MSGGPDSVPAAGGDGSTRPPGSSGTASSSSGDEHGFSDEDYRAILEFRTRLRRFLAWSGEQARAAGLTPTQHQLLLAVRGHPGPRPPTIGDVAEHLQLRHHSAVGLVDRAEAAGLVKREVDPHDRRVARVELSEAGRVALDHLTALHVVELRVLGDALIPDIPLGRPSSPEGEREPARDPS